MPKITELERRQFLRVSPDKEHAVSIDINGEGFIDVLNAEDISLGGISVRVPHGFKHCDLHQAQALDSPR